MKHLYSILMLFTITLSVSSCSDSGNDKTVQISESWLRGTWYAEPFDDINNISVTFKSREEVQSGENKDITIYWYEGEINYVKGKPSISPGQLTYGTTLFFNCAEKKAESFESILLSRNNGAYWGIEVTATTATEDSNALTVKAVKTDYEGNRKTYNLTLHRSQTTAWNN